MAYNPEQIEVIDKIRGKIGDIKDPPAIPDETYLSVIAQFADWRLACAEMADQLASVFLTRVQTFSRSGGISVSWSQRAENLRKLAVRLRQEVATENAQEASSVRSVEMCREERPHSQYRDMRRYRHDDW